jgi:hypothetical protein
MSVRIIPTTRGRFALVDEADFELVSRFKWYCSLSGYAIAHVREGGRQRAIAMHRLLMSPAPNLYVDHINHWRRDNRRCNLRVVTPQVNRLNAQPHGTHRAQYMKLLSPEEINPQGFPNFDVITHEELNQRIAAWEGDQMLANISVTVQVPA